MITEVASPRRDLPGVALRGTLSDIEHKTSVTKAAYIKARFQYDDGDRHTTVTAMAFGKTALAMANVLVDGPAHLYGVFDEQVFRIIRAHSNTPRKAAP